MLEKRESIAFDEKALERGYANCRKLVKKHLKPYIWPISNLPGENRRGADALLAHLLTTLDLLDLESTNGLSLDVWNEIRDDVSDAFLDKYASVELMALADTCRRFKIPKQFIFDPLRGADLWIRSRQFSTYDELQAFCSYVGGASLASMVPVAGFVKPDYELAAIACGKAMMLTKILENCVNDMKHNRTFIAQEDIESCEVDVSRLKMRQPTKAFRHLVRLYCSRLEGLFIEAGKLVTYLDFDGKRSLSSMLDTSYRTFSRMQLNPDTILSQDGVLTKTERFGLRTRHMLGLAPKVKIIPQEDHHH